MHPRRHPPPLRPTKARQQFPFRCCTRCVLGADSEPLLLPLLVWFASVHLQCGGWCPAAQSVGTCVERLAICFTLELAHAANAPPKCVHCFEAVQKHTEAFRCPASWDCSFPGALCQGSQQQLKQCCFFFESFSSLEHLPVTGGKK